MFTVRTQIGLVRSRSGLSRPPQKRADRTSRAGGFVPVAALAGLLALGLPQTSSAQSLGTLQVTARVVPASVAWTGVAEAGVAARSLVGQESGRPLIRRNGLVYTSAEIHRAGGRHLLLVTLHHPHN